MEIARQTLLSGGLILTIGIITSLLAQKIKIPDIAAFLIVGMVIGRFREPPARGVALPVEELAKFAAKLGAVNTWKASAGGHVEAVTSVLYGVSGLIQCGGE